MGKSNSRALRIVKQEDCLLEKNIARLEGNN